MQHDFPKMKGSGVKGRLKPFEKFIRFGTVTRPLIRIKIGSCLQFIDDLRWFMDFY